MPHTALAIWRRSSQIVGKHERVMVRLANSAPPLPGPLSLHPSRDRRLVSKSYRTHLRRFPFHRRLKQGDSEECGVPDEVVLIDFQLGESRSRCRRTLPGEAMSCLGTDVAGGRPGCLDQSLSGSLGVDRPQASEDGKVVVQPPSGGPLLQAVTAVLLTARFSACQVSSEYPLALIDGSLGETTARVYATAGESPAAWLVTTPR